MIVFSYFFQRTISFPLKFIFHRFPLGFEAYAIDWWMTFGLKYLATADAAELMMRHVQIEPLLYRHILGQPQRSQENAARRLNGIDGDFNIESLKIALNHGMTVGHDLLSYEVVERFDRDAFLERLDEIRAASRKITNRSARPYWKRTKSIPSSFLGRRISCS